MTQKQLAIRVLNYRLEPRTGARSPFPAHRGQRSNGDDKGQTHDRYPTCQLCSETDGQGLKKKTKQKTISPLKVNKGLLRKNSLYAAK